MRLWPLALAVTFVSLTGARAEGVHEMLAAEAELKIAKDHLSVAGTDYEGHRKTAMEHVDRALREVHLGIKAARTGEHEPKTGTTAPAATDD